MFGATTIPAINNKIARISVTLAGHQDLVLQISEKGAFWATELFHTNVPLELRSVFIGEHAVANAIAAYNNWKERQPK